MKTTNAEWQLFLQDKAVWGDSDKFWYEIDPGCLRVAGQVIQDDAMVDWTQFQDTDSVEIENGLFRSESDHCSLDAVWNRWKKKQQTRIMLLELPKTIPAEHLAQIKALVKQSGGRIR